MKIFNHKIMIATMFLTCSMNLAHCHFDEKEDITQKNYSSLRKILESEKENLSELETNTLLYFLEQEDESKKLPLDKHREPFQDITNHYKILNEILKNYFQSCVVKNSETKKIPSSHSLEKSTVSSKTKRPNIR